MLNLRVVGDTDDSVTARMEPEPGTDWTTGCHVSIRTLRSLGRLLPALQRPLSKHGHLIPRSLSPLGPGIQGLALKHTGGETAASCQWQRRPQSLPSNRQEQKV